MAVTRETKSEDLYTMRDPISRRKLLMSAATTGVSLGVAGLIVGCGGGSSAQSPASGVNSAEVRRAFQDIMLDEDNHVEFLKAALGASARPAPTFVAANITSPDVNTFIAQAAALENTGTGAYLAAVPLPALLASPDTLQAAASIALVEGRHAGFLNALLSRDLLTDPNSGDKTGPNNLSREVAQLPDQVTSRAAPFTAGVNLNGGPALPTNATIASASLTDILNYALFLEYLEKSFYDINVPRFFK